MIVDLCLILYFLFFAPILFLRKKRVGLHRLFILPPQAHGKKVIWLHAVSLGEVKALHPLFVRLKNLYPDVFFLITTTTKTGQEEAHRSFLTADAITYLPFDFGFIVKFWVKSLRPFLLVLVESDLWPNFLSAIQKQGGKTVLVSGKMSEKSFKRFSYFPTFTKRLFSKIDVLCVQTEEYYQRFYPFHFHPQITGNLKLCASPESIDLGLWKEKIRSPDLAITLASTHSGEEEMLLALLSIPSLFLFLAPRHPERFEEVSALLHSQKIPFFKWSALEKKQGNERVLLVDAMGQLPICYQLSKLAIVGGSFTPKIGGHNILEPCLYKIPVFFGPHMFSQKELVSYILTHQAGQQIAPENIVPQVSYFLKNPTYASQIKQNATLLAEASHHVLDRTIDAIV